MNKPTKLLLGCAAWFSTTVCNWGTVTDTYILLDGTIPYPAYTSNPINEGIRFLWDPAKRHFQAGKGNPGQAESGDYSFLFGRGLSVYGQYSWSAGQLNVSSSLHSYTFGYNNTSAGYAAIVMGSNSSATEAHGLAIGSHAQAWEIGSIALGTDVAVTSGASYATAIGRSIDALGAYSFVAGYDNTVWGMGSVALGRSITIEPPGASEGSEPAYAIGLGLEVRYPYAFVTGRYNARASTETDDYLFVVGNGTGVGSRSDAFAVDAYGNVWASGTFSSAAGNNYFQGNVGIGTSSPAYKVEVVGGASTSQTKLLQIRSDGNGNNTASTLRFANNTNDTAVQGSAEISAIRTNSGATGATDMLFRVAQGSSVAERMRITSNGRVGIGTNDPKEAFQIGNSIAFHNGGAKALAFNTYWNTTITPNEWRNLEGGYAGFVHFDPGNGNLNIGVSLNSTSAGEANSPWGMLTVRPNGSVEIPHGNLDVRGDIYLGNLSAGGRKLYLTNDTSHHYIWSNNWWTEFVDHSHQGWRLVNGETSTTVVTINASDHGQGDPAMVINGMLHASVPARGGIEMGNFQ